MNKESNERVTGKNVLKDNIIRYGIYLAVFILILAVVVSVYRLLNNNATVESSESELIEDMNQDSGISNTLENMGVTESEPSEPVESTDIPTTESPEIIIDEEILEEEPAVVETLRAETLQEDSSEGMEVDTDTTDYDVKDIHTDEQAPGFNGNIPERELLTTEEVNEAIDLLKK